LGTIFGVQPFNRFPRSREIALVLWWAVTPRSIKSQEHAKFDISDCGLPML
jgi:hypothetical protein